MQPASGRQESTASTRHAWRWIGWVLAAGALALAAGTAWTVRFPPPPEVARAYGSEGEAYLPDVLAMDAGGALSLGGRPLDLGPLRAGQPELLGRLEELLRPWFRAEPVHPDVPGATASRQVLAVAPEAPYALVAELVDGLIEIGVVRTCFAVTAADGSGGGLVHIRERGDLAGVSCGADIGTDPSFLFVEVGAEWEDGVLRWATAGSELVPGGDLDLLAERVTAKELLDVHIWAAPEADWGRVEAVLATVSAAGFAVYFPAPFEEDV